MRKINSFIYKILRDIEGQTGDGIHFGGGKELNIKRTKVVIQCAAALIQENIYTVPTLALKLNEACTYGLKARGPFFTCLLICCYLLIIFSLEAKKNQVSYIHLSFTWLSI